MGTTGKEALPTPCCCCRAKSERELRDRPPAPGLRCPNAVSRAGRVCHRSRDGADTASTQRPTQNVRAALDSRSTLDTSVHLLHRSTTTAGSSTASTSLWSTPFPRAQTPRQSCPFIPNCRRDLPRSAGLHRSSPSRIRYRCSCAVRILSSAPLPALVLLCGAPCLKFSVQFSRPCAPPRRVYSRSRSVKGEHVVFPSAASLLGPPFPPTPPRDAPQPRRDDGRVMLCPPTALHVLPSSVRLDCAIAR